MRNLPYLPRVAAVLAMVVVAGLSASSANASQRLTTYKLPAEFALPNDMTVGPDGATWVTDSSLGRIWRIATNGKTIVGTWKKTSVTGPTRFFDKAGKPVTLTIGQTFIQVMQLSSPVTVTPGKAVP